MKYTARAELQLLLGPQEMCAGLLGKNYLDIQEAENWAKHKTQSIDPANMRICLFIV